MQSLYFLRLQADRCIAPAEADVRMMAFRLSEFTDLLDKGPCFAKFAEPEGPLDTMCVVAEFPVRGLRTEAFGFLMQRRSSQSVLRRSVESATKADVRTRVLQALLLGRRVPDGCRVGTLLNLHGCIRCHFDTKIFGIVRGPARRRNLEHAAVIESALAGGGLNEATTGYKKNERAGRRVPGPDSGPAPRPSGSREKKGTGPNQPKGS